MKQGILAALLATLPVHALVDGQNLRRGTAECLPGSASAAVPPIAGHLWSNRYIKRNAAGGHWIWHADQWHAVDPNAIGRYGLTRRADSLLLPKWRDNVRRCPRQHVMQLCPSAGS
jgi:hypothetical protein